MKRFWKRHPGGLDLEAELSGNRARPRPEFVRALSRNVEDRSRNTRVYLLSRLSFAASLTVLIFGTLASFGGLSYAASGTTEVVAAVKQVVTQSKPRVVQSSAAQTQYKPRKVTICHKGNTITISESALPAHLRHGDSVGACASGRGGVAGAGGGGVAGAGGGGVAGAGGGGALGATGTLGTLPFTGLSLAGTLLLSLLLMGAGFALRRRATAVNH